jgi:hypothetical protein
MTSMEPQETQVNAPKSKLKLLIIVGGIFLVLALGVFYIVVVRGGGDAGAGFRSILPFGEAGDAVGVDVGDGKDKLGDVDIGAGGNGEELPRMWKIADGPVSGSIWKTLPSGDLSARYILREDGDVFEHSVNERSGKILANNTIPSVAEAVWDARGQSVVLRTATDQGDIVSILGRLLPNPASQSGDEAPAILEQSFLPENISFIAPGVDEGFVHTLRVGNELSIMVLDGSGRSTPVFTSPFTEWIPDWLGRGVLSLTTRPSGLVGGYLFSLDPEKGVLSPIMNDYLGLTIKSAPDGNSILVGGSKKGGATFGIITKELPIPSDISPTTLPEKCAWTASSTFAYCGVPQNPKGGVYPDEWYQGTMQFSDTIWVYDNSTGQFTLFVVPQDEVKEEIDVMNPSVSQDGSHLMFTNKKDGSLWGIRL